MYFSSISSRLLLYDTNSWDLKKSYGCYDGVLRDISWSDDSKYLLQVNSKGLVEILSAADHNVRSLQHIPLRDTWSASFHRDGHRNIAIGTKNGNVMVWDTKNKTITKSFPTPNQQSSVNYLSYNAKNTSLAAAMQNGDTVIYGLVSNIPVLTVKLSCSRSISAIKFHHESRALLGLATDEGHIVLRDITTNKDKVSFENVHVSPVSDFAFSLINKDVLLSSGYDKVMHIYDIRLQNVVSTIRTPYTLTSLAMNIENHVALGTKYGLVLIYDLRNMSQPFKVLKGHEEEVQRVAFQPHKKKVVPADISLQEDTEIFSPHTSPVRGRTSDMFFMDDTPPKNLEESVQGDAKADSFLVMMGLDKSNEEFDDDGNLSQPFKVLKWHEEEVQRVAFQPHKKKVVPADISLQEDTEIFSPHTSSVRGRTSDMFFMNDTPPKNLEVSVQGDAKADSVLVMMGLDKSNEEFDDDGNNKSADPERSSGRNELRYRQLDAEKNISKISTPLNSRTAENLGFPSPIGITNGIPDDGRGSQFNLSTIKQVNSNVNVMDTKALEEMKDFVKLTLSDVADDNRNYFLHIMMALTKQKLFLEKQLVGMNEQIQHLVQNQNALVEINRKLAMEIDQLKIQKHPF